MLDNIVSYLVAPHKFVNFNTLLPDEIPTDYVRVKFLFCGICGGDYSRYLGYRKEYPLSLGHEFVAQVLEHNCSSAMEIEIGNFVVSDFNYRCLKCRYCQKGKSHLCQKNDIELFTNRAFSLYADIHYSYLVKIDSSINSIYRATAIEPLSCIIHAMNNYDLSQINTVLIYGTGNIGMLCAFYLHTCQKKKVYVYDVIHQKCELVGHILGCDIAKFDIEYDLIVEATNTASGLLECIMRCEYNQKICSFSHLYGQKTEMIYTNLVKKEINIYFPLRNGSKNNLSQAAQFIKNNWTTCEDELLQIYETDDLNIAFEAKGNCIKPKQIIGFKAKQENS